MPSGSNYRSPRHNLMDELSKRDTPCEKFSCRNAGICGIRELACDAWSYYVATGRAVHPMMTIPERVTLRLQPVMGDKILATREKFFAAERDERGG